MKIFSLVGLSLDDGLALNDSEDYFGLEITTTSSLDDGLALNCTSEDCVREYFHPSKTVMTMAHIRSEQCPVHSIQRPLYPDRTATFVSSSVHPSVAAGKAIEETGVTYFQSAGRRATSQIGRSRPTIKPKNGLVSHGKLVIGKITRYYPG